MGEDVEFATKPELAMRMITRALDAGVPAGWVTGDEVYGQHGRLRMMLEERRMPYVLAVPVNQRVIATVQGRIAQLRADELAGDAAWAGLEEDLRRRRRQGPAGLPLGQGGDPPAGGHRQLLAAGAAQPDRPHRPGLLPVLGPEHAPLRELVRVAAPAGHIAETFQTAKGQVGLDQYQVRRYDSWYRHITLVMLAHAFLTVTTAHASQAADPKRGRPAASKTSSP